MTTHPKNGIRQRHMRSRVSRMARERRGDRTEAAFAAGLGLTV
ncbi:hypothetical protein P0W64_17665 [Tsukamurella sp. 8F]|nr:MULTISPECIES: hypothetical protein [unclassified Tsukamurella]MDF0532400.1 hypothetical protein [Tsukamurella sp. 8J]MDF0588614.1 hypothetical protein [Tsukamurella sp. 8F]